jgi:hypothetical protein
MRPAYDGSGPLECSFRADVPVYLTMIYKAIWSPLHRLTMAENQFTQLLYIIYKGWNWENEMSSTCGRLNMMNWLLMMSGQNRMLITQTEPNKNIRNTCPGHNFVTTTGK